MPEISKGKILAGRRAVDAYRTAHAKLYEHGWRRGIPEEHTPLLNTMLAEFKKQGFNSLQEFFAASEELNTTELNKMYLREGECNLCGKCCLECKDYVGNGICSIHKAKPKDCANYPIAKDFVSGLPEGCSYSFTRTAYQTTVDTKWN